jgi:hypothetical protein
MTRALAAAAMMASTGAALSAPICEGRSCIDELIAKGWRHIANCEGHAWSSLLERDKEMVICKGIAAAGGPTEQCESFRGDPEQYRIATAKLTAGGRDCWGWSQPLPSHQPGK